jgi:hypothetical protein
MARQKKIILSGRVSNIIFYEFRGIACARTRPARVRQTKATKSSAKQFGKAVRMSRVLRSGLDFILPDPRDKSMMYRLNNALLQWLLQTKPGSKLTTDLPFISGFEFNEESLLTSRLKLSLTIGWTTRGKIIVDLPEFVPVRDIAAPAYTKRVHLKIAVTGCSVDDLTAVPRSETTIVDMEYNDKPIAAKRIGLPFTVRAGEIAIVAVGLNYEAAKKGIVQLVNDKRWLPVGIAGNCFKTSKG